MAQELNPVVHEMWHTTKNVYMRSWKTFICNELFTIFKIAFKPS